MATTLQGLDEVARTKLLAHSIEILSQLVEQSPAHALYHRELAASLHYLSYAQRATDLAAARRSMQQSVEQLGAAVDLAPERTWDRLRLAGAQAHAGVLAQEANDHGAAIEALRAAIHTIESFNWTGFDRMRAREQILAAHRLCITALEASVRLEEAYEQAVAAARVHERFADADAPRQDNAAQFARECETAAGLARSRGDVDAAAAWIQRARALGKPAPRE
jgi:hypothetical protein